MKATSLNIWVLKKVMAGGVRCEARFPPTNLPHLRRCIKAGLAIVDGGELVLTSTGVAAMASNEAAS